MPDTEITFQVKEPPEDGCEAHALGYSIFTEGDDWERLKYMLRDAVLCHPDKGEMPRLIHVDLAPEEGVPS